MRGGLAPDPTGGQSPPSEGGSSEEEPASTVGSLLGPSQVRRPCSNSFSWPRTQVLAGSLCAAECCARLLRVYFSATALLPLMWKTCRT